MEQGASGFGTVQGAPRLPEGFSATFQSRLVEVDGVRLHAVVGGHGPPLLLISGWPQCWYEWRLVMPRLAQEYRVVAADPRGVGLSDKPEGGYDSGSLAGEFVDLMETLGHRRFALMGHDVGMWTSYALASDFPDRVERLVLVDATIPGLAPSIPLFSADAVNDTTWHFGFNRLHNLNERLVTGREELLLRDQFATKGATPTTMPEYAVRFYVDMLRRSPQALHASFNFYRAIEEIIEQNDQRKRRKLRMPVLSVGGEHGQSDRVRSALEPVVVDLTHVTITDSGHYVPEEQPRQLLDHLLPFLRSGSSPGDGRRTNQ
ncbi:MAG: alpha/beta hydrolase [Kutzneria sp.]|nr:alpha/beta hydrolase [Kutzneria sp.]MBV9846035.1 alpha/beta hydrolase [Kutzneria sp.]